MDQREKCRKNVIGWVYLIRLEKRYPNGKHPQYYIGWTEHDPALRLEYHRSGKGSSLLEACNKLGIKYKIVRVWRKQTRAFERKLKNNGHYDRYCPIKNKRLWRNKARKFITY